MSLLTIITDACDELGVDRPSSVLSSGDSTYLQLARLAQREGDELARSHEWRELKVDWTITGNGTDQLFALPADFNRNSAGTVFWLNANSRLPLVGPASDAEWVGLRVSTAGIYRRVWRLEGESLRVYPTLTNDEQVFGLYISRNWILSGSTPVARWQTDADTSRLPEELITAGVIWRWKKAKGFDFTADFADYWDMREKLAGNNVGLRVLAFGEDPRDDLPTPIIPETLAIT